MTSRITFNRVRPEADDIWKYYRDMSVALEYFQKQMIILINEPSVEKPQELQSYYSMTIGEFRNGMEKTKDELDQEVTLALISTFEAEIRIDFLNRVYKKRRDPVSQRFRTLYQTEGERTRLEDLLDEWKTAYPSCRKVVGQFKELIKIRNWLAHGRYRTPKFGPMSDPLNTFKIGTKLTSFMQRPSS